MKGKKENLLETPKPIKVSSHYQGQFLSVGIVFTTRSHAKQSEDSI